MKILIYGAGVIGSVYASKLFEAKQDVTLLARGSRYESLIQNGVIIKDSLTGKQLTSHIPLIQKLNTTDFYDLIIIAIRLNQLESVLASLNQNTGCPLIMLMMNTPELLNKLAKELSPKHLILGFPGIGGTYEGNTINFSQIKQQKTTIGDSDGKITSSTKDIKSILETAGFSVDISANMEAWLKVHAIFIACISAAISKENGDSIQLGKNRSAVKTTIISIHEGFSACEKLGIPIVPVNLKTIFMTMPKWFSILYWQYAMKGKIGTLTMAPHVNAAKDEMQLVAEKALHIIHLAKISTPTVDKLLLDFINSK